MDPQLKASQSWDACRAAGTCSDTRDGDVGEPGPQSPTTSCSNSPNPRPVTLLMTQHLTPEQNLCSQATAPPFLLNLHAVRGVTARTSALPRLLGDLGVDTPALLGLWGTQGLDLGASVLSLRQCEALGTILPSQHPSSSQNIPSAELSQPALTAPTASAGRCLPELYITLGFGVFLFFLEGNLLPGNTAMALLPPPKPRPRSVCTSANIGHICSRVAGGCIRVFWLGQGFPFVFQRLQSGEVIDAGGCESYGGPEKPLKDPTGRAAASSPCGFTPSMSSVPWAARRVKMQVFSPKKGCAVRRHRWGSNLSAAKPESKHLHPQSRCSSINHGPVTPTAVD